MDVVLVQPEIPHNTGCAARLCAALGARLHLVRPLGFSLEDRYLKRAGLDYWPLVDLYVHDDLDACLGALGLSAPPAPRRLMLFSARGGTSLFDVDFAPSDALVFGSESGGLAPAVRAHPAAKAVRIPIHPSIRSLNLANTVAIGLYTAMHSAGVPFPEGEGEYRPHPDRERDVWPHHIAREGTSAGVQDDQPGPRRDPGLGTQGVDVDLGQRP